MRQLSRALLVWRIRAFRTIGKIFCCCKTGARSPSRPRSSWDGFEPVQTRSMTEQFWAMDEDLGSTTFPILYREDAPGVVYSNKRRLEEPFIGSGSGAVCRVFTVNRDNESRMIDLLYAMLYRSHGFPGRNPPIGETNVRKLLMAVRAIKEWTLPMVDILRMTKGAATRLPEEVACKKIALVILMYSSFAQAHLYQFDHLNLTHELCEIIDAVLVCLCEEIQYKISQHAHVLRLNSFGASGSSFSADLPPRPPSLARRISYGSLERFVPISEDKE
nr:hypothetical protein [Sicyoidochytrium minutum DNA virus]